MPFHFVFYFLHGDFSSEFLLQRSDSFVVYSAGDDMAEIAEVCVDVEGKPVHRDPAAGFDSEGTDFPRIFLFDRI
jgi:hypothetical protein